MGKCTAAIRSLIFCHAILFGLLALPLLSARSAEAADAMYDHNSNETRILNTHQPGHEDKRWPQSSRLLSSANPSEKVASALLAIDNLLTSIVSLLGLGDVSEIDCDVRFYSEEGDSRLVDRLLRSVVVDRSFVFAVGGMSDTAGHGNRASEAYPQVCGDTVTKTPASVIWKTVTVGQSLPRTNTKPTGHGQSAPACV
jgi:hypothetical protein